MTVEYECDIIVDDEVECCLANGDANEDGSIDVLDIVTIVNWILGG